MSLKYFEVIYSTKGKQSKVVLQAANRAETIKIFKARNPDSSIAKITETSVPLNETIEKFKNTLIDAIFKKSVKTEFLIASFRQLAVMANAGIPIHDSVKEVGKAAADERLRSIFAKIDDDLNSGLSLTASASAFKEELGDISIAMIELGENTGNMADSLKKLADILEEVNDNKKKFKKAIRYPLTIVTAMAIAFIILMTQVVPKFRDIFKQLGAEEKLPIPTKILLSTESVLTNYGLYILGVGIVGFIFIARSYKQNPIFHAQCDKYMLKTYLIGKIIFFSNLNRFTLVLSELIRAGIPVVEALDTSLLTITNTTLQERLALVKISIQRGVSLTDAFRETGLFENMLIQMIQAGEQSGTLDMMLSKVTDYFRDRFNAIIDNLSSYIEPILLAFLACMVLLLALGIFMPMWEMGAAARGG
ncbi:MAG: type II secretion system F family protein [Campylobacteraceae bacterium]|jgi:general secretion pathway protein F/MSHA biogenesis protein MshG|nr:type II secretion system F family protein [Campylobacteraceae bacterium]